MAEIDFLEVLDYWFIDPVNPPEEARKRWFHKSEETDAFIRDEFGFLLDPANSGRLENWRSTELGTLAVVIVLDQFSRNIYRDTPQAFAADAKALKISKQAVANGQALLLTSFQRLFLYMPFMHSEAIVDQEVSVKLFKELEAQEGSSFQLNAKYAIEHRDVIKKFSRFPHRNSILGRESTNEELIYLEDPNSGF